MYSNTNIVGMDYVKFNITWQGVTFPAEKRFPTSLTVYELKGKLELQTGIIASEMQLEMYDSEDQLMGKLTGCDNRTLAEVNFAGVVRVHVTGRSILKNEFEDPNVEKFQISEEEYSKRSDTVKAFLQKNKMGKYNPAEVEFKETAKRNEEEAQETAAGLLKLNARCEVRLPSKPTRRGLIAYIGPVNFADGKWVGIHYDEPVGKNNGTVGGKFYFVCPDKYGGFVRPLAVTMGDFPEEGMDLDDEI